MSHGEHSDYPRRARIIGLFSLSHEQNKARFNYAVARKQRRSQFKRMLNGIYTDGLRLPVGKKSLEEIFFKEWPEARNVMDPRSGGHGFF